MYIWICVQPIPFQWHFQRSFQNLNLKLVCLFSLEHGKRDLQAFALNFGKCFTKSFSGGTGCMYVYMYVYMHICMYVRMYVCVCVSSERKQIRYVPLAFTRPNKRETKTYTRMHTHQEEDKPLWLKTLNIQVWKEAHNYWYTDNGKYFGLVPLQQNLNGKIRIVHMQFARTEELLSVGHWHQRACVCSKSIPCCCHWRGRHGKFNWDLATYRSIAESRT